MMKSLLPFLTVGFFFFVGLSTTKAQLSPADSLAYTHFDFWIGEWDVYKMGTDTLVGQSRIESIINGRAIQEHYQSTSNPYQGTSLNKWNPQAKQWEQYWVDNGGLSLHIKGGLVGDKMVMGNSVTTPQGILYNRISWTPLVDGGVRQTWEQSYGDGQWTVVFDGHYKKK